MRKVENLPTQGSDKPTKDVVITNCGELTGDEADAADQKAPDPTGDGYEDFPEDQAKTNTAKETVKIAGDLKEFGNKAFKSGNLALGLEKYQKGIRYLNEEPSLEDEPPETKKNLDSLRFTLHANSALLANKQKLYDEALKHASSALEVANLTDAEKAKALFRRGQAEVGLKDEDAALKDLEEANKLVPGDAAVIKELAAIKKTAADRAKKEKALYSKAFT